jgi:hypothetical protein
MKAARWRMQIARRKAREGVTKPTVRPMMSWQWRFWV